MSVNFYSELHKQLVAEGMFRPNWPVQIYRVLEVVVLQVLALWLVCNYSWVLGGLVYGLVVGRCVHV